MALPSFLPFRFPPSSISPLLKFHSSLLIYRSRVYFSSLFFSLFFFLLCHRSFFPRSSCFINRRSCLFTVEYIALSSISSQFLRFYRILPSRFDVPFTEPLWSSALFPFLFSPLSSSYNAWNDFLLCTPIHICTLRRAFPHFLTTVFRFRYDRNYILNFLLCLDNLHSTTRHSSLSLSLMTLLFLIMHFLKATRKIIKIIRLLYRIISYSCLISFFKTVYKQFWRFNLYVLHAWWRNNELSP